MVNDGPSKRWTDQELAIIEKHLDAKADDLMALLPGRTKGSIDSVLKRERLRKLAESRIEYKRESEYGPCVQCQVLTNNARYHGKHVCARCEPHWYQQLS